MPLTSIVKSKSLGFVFFVIAPALSSACAADPDEESKTRTSSELVANSGPLPSGLMWPSGAKDNLGCLALERGRAIDIGHVHVAPQCDAGGGGCDFPDMLRATRGWISRYDAGHPAALNSFALLPAARAGQFAACASGAFDGYWRDIGTALAAVGRPIVVELGWEANLGSRTHPWGVDELGQVEDYKRCFRSASTAIQSTFPQVQIAWTNSKIYRKDYTVEQMDPSLPNFPNAFHMYGLMYYDNYIPLKSQATWDERVNSYNGTGGSPSGIGSWLTYATAHGRKLGVSEWGIWQRDGLTTADADDPIYIENMFRFFKSHAASIVYEAYQNNGRPDDLHTLCSDTMRSYRPFPSASARYFELWSGG